MTSAIRLFLFLLFLFPQFSFSQDEGGSSSIGFGGGGGASMVLPVHFDFHYLMGQGEVGGNDGLSAMESNETSFGITLGYQFFNFLILGIGYDSMTFAQTEAIDDEIGNVSGTITSPFTPVLGFKFMDFTFKYTMHMFGEYELDKQTVLGNNLEFGNISGNRMELMYRAWWRIHVGLYSQTLSFSEQFDTGLGKNDLSSEFEISQTGLALAIAY